MELGRRPPASAALLDDVDRAYVVSQLEGTMDETVELRLAVTRTSPLLLPGMAASDARASEEARRAEQFATELGGLVPRLRTAVVDGPSTVPVFSLACPGGGTVRFLGLPRVNLFRALLEAVRRASTRDHGFLPTVIVNDRLSTEGSVPDESLLELVVHATDPSRPPPGITSVPFRSCGRLEKD